MYSCSRTCLPLKRYRVKKLPHSKVVDFKNKEYFHIDDEASESLSQNCYVEIMSSLLGHVKLSSGATFQSYTL